MSNSVRLHRRQPIRLPRPWDSPGKKTGAGCHFLLQFMKVKSESEVTQSCPTLHDTMDCSLPGSSIHGIFHARVLEWGAIYFWMLYKHTNIKEQCQSFAVTLDFATAQSPWLVLSLIMTNCWQSCKEESLSYPA